MQVKQETIEKKHETHTKKETVDPIPVIVLAFTGISFPLPMSYALLAKRFPLLNLKLFNLQILGIFCWVPLMLCSSRHSTSATRTPSRPPYYRRASFICSALVTCPSLIYLRIWDFAAAAILSAAPLPPCGSLKSTPVTFIPVDP